MTDRVCTEAGCGRVRWARGLCHRCYDVHRHAGDLDSFVNPAKEQTLSDIERDPTWRKWNPSGWPWTRTGQTPKEWAADWRKAHPRDA